MYVNGNMISVETVPDMWGGIKENGKGSTFRCDILIYCKNFCKCHRYHHSVKQFLKKKMMLYL
jgi:hypothetical protein